MSYASESKKTVSEKITLATVDSTKLAKIFTFSAGNYYSRQVDYFVIDVKENGYSYTQVYSLDNMDPNRFLYDTDTKTLYVQTSDDSDPKTKDLNITYRHFFSTKPIILPWDLDAGIEVEWLPLINSIGSVGQQLDDESTGIVLESSSQIDLINQGYFDSIFDTMIWENKTVNFYSHFGGLLPNEATKIFEGVIESKDYSPDRINFKVRDFVFRLRNFVNLSLFTQADAVNGQITDSIIGTPKRRIYGQVKQVKAVPISNTLDGYNLTGTISTTIGTTTLSGSGTLFLSQLSPGDEIIFTWLGTEYKYGIDSITSNTSAVLNKNSDVTSVSVSAIVNPEIPYRGSNRYWHLAGHRLREPTTTISTVIANNRFILNNASDLFVDDNVIIDGIPVQIKRISGNEIVTKTSVTPIPVVGDTVTKLPIQDVYFGSKRLTYLTDWTYVNSVDTKIQITTLAEFNNTQEKLASVNFTFTNSSNSLTTTSTVDLRTFLKPRDWIKKNSIVSGEGDWYEILEVKEQSLKIRSNYTGSTATTSALIKQVTYIEDESLITVNCLGLEISSTWVKTPSDVVKDLITSDAGFYNLDYSTFDQAKSDCDYIVSMVIPEDIGGSIPTIRDIIGKINESCFGSLYGNSSSSICYSVLNANKPETIEILKDEDIISFSADTINEIYNFIKLSYRPFVDHQNQENTFETALYNSGFVDNNIGIKKVLEKTIYLYESDKADIIAQRYAFFKSLSSLKMNVKGKANFFTTNVNDKFIFNLDRLFYKYGSTSRFKVAIVTGVKKSQFDSEVTVNDLAVYTRVPAIAPNSASDYGTADQSEIVRWGYVCDNDTLTPSTSSEDNLGCNLIG